MDLSGFYPPANPSKSGAGTDSPLGGAGGAMAGVGAGASAPPAAEDAPPPYTTLPRSPSEAGASPWIGKMDIVCGFWIIWYNTVPTRTGKPGKTGEHFPVRENPGILLRLENSENFTQHTVKIRKKYTQKLKKILEKWAKFASH